MATGDRRVLYRQRLDGGEDRTDVFHLTDQRIVTRAGGVYEWDHTVNGIKTGERFATVEELNNDQVQLHSTKLRAGNLVAKRSFVETLTSYGHESWWELMHCNEDGEWIRRAIPMGTLAISHDGPYMPDKSSVVLGAGVFEYCTATEKSLKIGLVEPIVFKFPLSAVVCNSIHKIAHPSVSARNSNGKCPSGAPLYINLCM